MLVSSIGLALGVAGGFTAGEASGGAISGTASQSAFGASVGTVQWLALRWQLSLAGWWVLVTTLGMGVGFALGQVLRWSGYCDSLLRRGSRGRHPPSAIFTLADGSNLDGSSAPRDRAD